MLPIALASCREEVDRETAQRAPLFEHFRHPPPGLPDVPAVLGVSRESAAEEYLTRRSAQYLVVRRDDGDLAQGIYATLHQRGAHLLPTFQETLDYSTHLREVVASVLVRVVLSVIRHILGEYLLLHGDVVLDRAPEIRVADSVRAVGQGG